MKIERATKEEIKEGLNFSDPIYHRIYIGKGTIALDTSYKDAKLNSSEFLESINEVIYKKNRTIKDTSNTYRTINHWTEEGLLDDERNNLRGWRKFNLLELVWIEILTKLRDFGMPLKKLKIVKNYIIPNGDTFESNFRVQNLEFYIMRSISALNKNKLIVFDDGVAGFTTETDLQLSEDHFGIKNYIHIDFDTLVNKVLGKENSFRESTMLSVDRKSKNMINKIFDIEDESEVTIKVKKGQVQKYKIEKSKNKEIIKDVKSVNLRELTKRKNSKITIHTNKDEKITSIVVESDD